MFRTKQRRRKYYAGLLGWAVTILIIAGLLSGSRGLQITGVLALILAVYPFDVACTVRALETEIDKLAFFDLLELYGYIETKLDRVAGDTGD